MMFLVVLEGPQQGRQFPLPARCALIGRERDADICLPGQRVSRMHAQIRCLGVDYFVEDLGSRNGTLLNGQAVTGRVPLTPSDRLEVGEFILGLRPDPAAVMPKSNLVIHEQVSAVPSNAALFAQNPAQKLQVVLEIAQELGTAADLQALLDNLLVHLLRLFPAADRGLVLLCEQDSLVVRAQRSRRSRRDADSSVPYSRTIVNKSLADGVGLLSLDVRSDDRFGHSVSVVQGDVDSVLCVPLIAKDKRRLGVLELDRTASVSVFQAEDLRLLTTLALLVSGAIESAGLQADRLRQEVLRKELAVAQEIQRGFLPSDFATPPGAGYELFACLHPAREVAGDLYDFFPLPDGRLALFAGDVSGKGMPAALFMVAVRTLARHLAPLGSGPAETLTRLNDALAADNPALMFVTLAYAIYDPRTGETVLATGGHPPPLLWRPDGQTDAVELPPGRVLGYPGPGLRLGERRLCLAPGEALAFYSDGFTEAFAPDGERMFGVEGLQAVLRAGAGLTLAEAGARARDAVGRFTASRELQDDQMLLLLRRL